MKIRRIISCALSGVLMFSTFCFPVSADTSSVSLKVGSGGYATIQQAVDSVPAGKGAVITIDPGVYEEYVVVDKPNISFVNSNKNKQVIITYDRGGGHTDPAKNLGTDKSATVIVTAEADGFSAKNITFRNSFNIGTDFKQAQAVAFESLADKVVLESCSFIGRQDTLYLKGASMGQKVYGQANQARVYLKDCYIEGTVDFIFGDATAYFDNCNLHMVYDEDGGHFTAANTTLFNVGYVFNECTLTTDEKYNSGNAEIDLGRPWQADGGYPNYGSSTVFINCKMSDVIAEKGFSLWDANTIAEKVRYYEYNSKNLKGKAIDLSKRDSFVRIMTDEQAKVYTAYSVLSGNDGWNPANEIKTKPATMDITLDKYSMEIPQGESDSIKAFVIGGGKYSLESDNKAVAIVENGKVLAVSQGNANITATTENGFKAVARVNVVAPRTAFPVIKDIKIDHISTFEAGTKMTVNYTYQLESDNDTDMARISWYSVKDNQEILLKQGVGNSFKSYTVESSDVGCTFKVVVEPATKTTYGTFGKGVAVSDKSVVSGDNSTVLIKTGFNKGTDGFVASENWAKVKANTNYLVAPTCDEDTFATLDYEAELENASFNGKFRFNPDQTGLVAEDVANIYLNYKENTGYKLNIVRGSNTKSLKMYIYKVTAEGEKLLASDETSMKNNVLQNSGEDNPFFYIGFSKSADTLTATFTLEGSDANLVKLVARDTSPLKAGGLHLEFKGKPEVWMLDTLSYESNETAKDAIYVYLAGDSTVKDYGASNTIGGWGEFIGNYFTDDVVIVNKAEGGRSTRSFINQGRLDEILGMGKKGDYLLIQFGHNDSLATDTAQMEHSVSLGTPDENGIYPSIVGTKVKTPQRIVDFYANDNYPYSEMFYPYDTGTFKWYLEQYVDKAREKGMNPVVITPVCRVFFDADGKITPHFGEDNGYVEAVRQVAKEKNCPLIDMYNITSALYESYGVLTTQGLHNVKSDGSMDLTHYNKFGANLIASKMAQSLSEQNIAIAKDTKASNVSVNKVDEMKSANLFVVGDVCADADDKDNIVPSVSFAQKLSDYFVDKITVKDFTSTDCTAKNYAASEKYSQLMSQVKEGDYVLLNFGRLDYDKSTTDKFFDEFSDVSGDVNTKGSFSYIMYNNYIKPLVEKKAVPVILTPIVDGNFKNEVAINNIKPYSEALKQLVVDNSLYFVDMNTQTADLYTNMGVDGSKVLNAIDKEKGIERNRLSEFGADTVARMFVNSMKYSSATLKNYIDETKISQADVLTKAEFVSGVVSVLGASDTQGENFKDVVKGKSYYNAILSAKNCGIVKADFRGNFKPEEQLYGDNCIQIIKAALEYKGKNVTALADVYNLMATDKAVSNEIGLYAVVRLYEILN